MVTPSEATQADNLSHKRNNMNLIELNKLIDSLHPVHDADLIAFYKEKRIELKARIADEVRKRLRTIKR